jgi:chromosome segregation ATPase
MSKMTADEALQLLAWAEEDRDVAKHELEKMQAHHAETEAEVERLRAQLALPWQEQQDSDRVNELEAEVERLQDRLDALRESHFAQPHPLRAEVERLRAKVGRVEEAIEVIHGTRHASPPMDASECVVILRNALAEEVTPIQTDP